MIKKSSLKSLALLALLPMIVANYGSASQGDKGEVRPSNLQGKKFADPVKKMGRFSEFKSKDIFPAAKMAADRAEYLRSTVTANGFDIEHFSGSQASRILDGQSGGEVIEVTIFRNWVELNRSTGERASVEDSDTYRLPVEGVGSGVQPLIGGGEIAAEGEMDGEREGEGGEDAEVPEGFESETEYPGDPQPEDAAMNDGVAVASSRGNFTTTHAIKEGSDI